MRKQNRIAVVSIFIIRNSKIESLREEGDRKFGKMGKWERKIGIKMGERET